MTGPRRTSDREITDTGWEHIFRIELKSRAQTEVVMNYVRDLTESELRRLTDHELGAIAAGVEVEEYLKGEELTDSELESISLRVKFQKAAIVHEIGHGSIAHMPRPPQPPLAADALIALLVPAKRADAILQCLEEYFERDCLTKGLPRARVLHWCRVLHSVRPLLWPALKRLFAACVGLDVLRRWIGR